MQAIYAMYDSLSNRLRSASDYLWPLLLRLIMFWEFWEAGYINKYSALYGNNGENAGNVINWFSSLDFPFPFNLLDGATNAYLACWSEMIFAILILFGLFTRFAAISLIVITSVAISAAHWPESWDSLSQLWGGYSISNEGLGNYKLALLFILMLIPLVFHGGGKLSLDKLILKMTGRDQTSVPTKVNFYTYALIFAIPALALIWVMPKTGISLLIIALALAFYQKLARFDS